MILARFKQPINMGESAHEISLFMLILTPNKEKGTKQALETGRTFATIFTDKDFKHKLLLARNETEFKSLMMLRAHQLSERKPLRNRHKYKLDPAVQLSISSSFSNFSSIEASIDAMYTTTNNNNRNKQASSNFNSKLELVKRTESEAACGKKNPMLNHSNDNNNNDTNDNKNDSSSDRAVVFDKNPRASKLFELIAQASPLKQFAGDKQPPAMESIDPTLFESKCKTQKKSSSCLISVCRHIEFGKGLWDDLGRRLRYYASDYKDAFVGPPKTMQKTVATIWFLYFGILLPTIAFSVLNRLQTNGFMGDLRKALIGQALGGLGFALLGGQPLVIIMTTAPLCLYTKG